jgi:hypothetical protein
VDPQKARIFSVLPGAVVGSMVLLVGCGSATSAEPRSGHIDPRSTVSNINGSRKTEETTAPVDKSLGFVAAALGATAAEEARAACRPGMVSVDGRYCIDRYEASLLEMLPNGEERPVSPFTTVRDSQHVRAVSEADVYPQGYISRNQAERACFASGKRLCRVAEWRQACRGPEDKQYGYAEHREVGRCNDNGKNPVMTLFGPHYDASTMNQPQLNQMDGTLAKTGQHAGCSNGYGVYDMVGNLHEWVSDPNGTFYGGYYQDVASIGHGDGCGYQTTAHAARYHDYSTGFRCCADPIGAETNVTVSPPATAPPPPAPKPKARKRRH